MILALLVAPAFAECIGDAGNSAAGWGCRREVAGHHLLDLHGTDARIGEIYGRLLQPELDDAYVPMMEDMYGVLPGAFRSAWRRYRGRFPDLLDADMEARAAGLERALSLSPGTVARYAWFSELSSVGPSLRVALAPATMPRLPEGGCTTLVGRDGARTVQARNVDYWGMGFWQKHATIVAVDPRDASGGSDGLRYLQVADVGEVFAGLTGVNERGLVVTTHVRVTRDVAPLEGRVALRPLGLWWRMQVSRRRPEVSVYRIVETVLRRAANVEEALDLAAPLRAVGAWTFIVSDPTGDRAVIDVDARNVKAQRGVSVTTNLALDAGMAAREFRPSRGPVEGALLRRARAQALLDEGGGQLTVERAVSILRDRFDLATGSIRPASANTIASTDTTQSVVFVTDPAAPPMLWVAEPHADGYFPAPFAPFHGLGFEAAFDAARCPDGCVAGTIPYVGDPALDAPLAHYVRAMADMLDHADVPGALAELRAAAASDPASGLMAAWLAASEGELAAASRELDGVLGRRAQLSPYHRILAALLQGEIAREDGREGDARAAWRDALAEARAEDTPLNAPIVAILASRLAPGRHRATDLPAPDLKFQDVMGLTTAGDPQP